MSNDQQADMLQRIEVLEHEVEEIRGWIGPAYTAEGIHMNQEFTINEERIIKHVTRAVMVDVKATARDLRHRGAEDRQEAEEEAYDACMEAYQAWADEFMQEMYDAVDAAIQEWMQR